MYFTNSLLLFLYGFAGNVNPGCAPKKSNGRMTRSWQNHRYPPFLEEGKKGIGSSGIDNAAVLP
jgi:hypothetical protein